MPSQIGCENLAHIVGYRDCRLGGEEDGECLGQLFEGSDEERSSTLILGKTHLEKLSKHEDGGR